MAKINSLVVAIYKLVGKFPKGEIFGLSMQMERSVVSIPSNIAEGRNRGIRKDFIYFLRIAYGFGVELEHYYILYNYQKDYLIYHPRVILK